MQPRITTSTHIDTSGKHGRDGIMSGYTGGKGEDGKDGHDAKDIHVLLNVDDDAKCIHLYSKDETIPPASLPLGDSAAVINLTANGGRGGKGAEGGIGKRGYDGANGSDATRFSNGTSGSNGGTGGTGGPGGSGGDGGKAANISIILDPADTDLLMLVQHQQSGGKGGKGGPGGPGGPGGQGGRGGSSYSWTDYSTYTDSEGRQQSIAHYHSNSGGSDGQNGSTGSRGAKGKSGKDGRDGQYTINIPNMGIYQERYDVKVEHYDGDLSDDNIIEPEESLELRQFTLKNTTSMPTPAVIHVYLAENRWIGFDPTNTLKTATTILPGNQLTLEQPLKFHIKPTGTAIPAVDTTFCQETMIPLRAALPRVNKEFNTVSRQKAPITIRYPIEISVVSNAQTIARYEELPFAIKLRNISSRPVGLHTKGERALQLQLNIEENKSNAINELTVVEKTADIPFDLSQPFISNFQLDAGDTKYLSGTLRFANPAMPAYTKFRLSFTLALGDINTGAQLHDIQKRTFNVQLADAYQHDPNANFVLVTNCNTKKETVDAYKEIAKHLGTSLSVWNASLYAGLSYHQTRNDQGSFKSELQDKVIIILDDPFPLNDNQKIKATDFLDQKELLDAVTSAHIATYVMSESFDMESACTPPLKLEKDATPLETVTVTENYFKWNQPTIFDLQKRAEAMLNKWRHETPTSHYLLVLELAPIKMSGGILDTWQVGYIKLYPALDKHQSHIAYRQKSPQQVDQYDIFNMIKLLPFAKKLACLEHCAQSTNYQKLVKNAILSDLVDELLPYIKNTWLRESSKAKIGASLNALNALIKHDLSFMKSCESLKNEIKDLFIEYQYFISKIPNVADVLFFPWCKYRTSLSAVCNEKISTLLRNYFPKENLADKFARLDKTWKKLPKEEFFHRFSGAYLAGTAYDNHLELTETVLSEQVKVYHPKTSKFTEGLHFFKTSAERAASIEAHEKNCQFSI